MQTPLLLFFAWARNLLCDDLRWHIYHTLRQTLCTRCGVALEGPRRVTMCFVRSERLCFVCYHRAMAR